MVMAIIILVLMVMEMAIILKVMVVMSDAKYVKLLMESVEFQYGFGYLLIHSVKAKFKVS